MPLVRAAFEAVDPSIELHATLDDGSPLEHGSIIASVEGPLASILSAERIALNFLQRLSGTATLTRQLVDVVAGLPVRVVDTRKTTPGLRALERYAVRVGGGHNHRYNLTDGVLIKDNHIAAGRSRGLTLGAGHRRRAGGRAAHAAHRGRGDELRGGAGGGRSARRRDPARQHDAAGDGALRAR